MALQKRWRMAQKKGKWQRVVPSPRPVEVVEMHTIRDAVGHGHLVIAGGGGGIPVIRDHQGLLYGVEAVIDKDYTAALLAVALDAEILVILTDVAKVSLNFGSSEERCLSRMEISTARRFLKAGEFPPGSMGPKVEAAVQFVEGRGRPALITNMESLEAALEGKAGTWVMPEKEAAEMI
jgi:carbamate kinase